MPRYDGKRKIASLALPASASDNANFECFYEIKAGEQASIYRLAAFVDTVDAGVGIEVVRSDAPTTALATVSIATAGAAEDLSTTFPVLVTNTTSASVFLRFRAAGAIDTGVGSVICEVGR